MSIYDKTKMICRTWIESVNNLFNMGKDLETEVDGLKGGIVKDVTLTEVDKHYTLTILYDDDTYDTVTWDDSTVGIEDITMTYQDGVYILTIILTDGTRYTFSIPVGNVVTEEELQSAVDTINATITAMNVGSPDDTASATGSLWARMKNAVARITTNEGNITSLQTADTQNVKLSGNQLVNGIKTYLAYQVGIMRNVITINPPSPTIIATTPCIRIFKVNSSDFFKIKIDALAVLGGFVCRWSYNGNDTPYGGMIKSWGGYKLFYAVTDTEKFLILQFPGSFGRNVITIDYESDTMGTSDSQCLEPLTNQSYEAIPTVGDVYNRVIQIDVIQ